MAAVGDGPQGCDLEPVRSRPEEERLAMLGDAGYALAREFALSERLDQAATRTWVALEAFFKAHQAREPELAAVARAGEAVLLAEGSGDDDRLILTLPVRLGSGPERMVALSVRRAQDRPHGRRPADDARDRPSLGRPGDPSGRELVAPEEPAARPLTVGASRWERYWRPLSNQAFSVSMKDCVGPGGRVGLSAVVGWLGKVREHALGPIGPRLLGDLRTGQFNLLTATVSARMLGEATALDQIRPALRLERLAESSFSLSVGFWAVDSEGRDGWPLAEGEIRVECIDPRGGRRPLPDYLMAHLRDLERTQPAPIPSGAGSLAALLEDRGPIWVPASPGLALTFEAHKTTPDDGNIAGNVYFREPFLWQGRAAQALLHKICPGLYPPDDRDVGPVCVSAAVDFLREGRPFEDIQTRLSLLGLGAKTIDLGCEFVRCRDDQPEELLAQGHQRLLWIRHRPEGPTDLDWPDDLTAALQSSAGLLAQEARLPASA
jgi:acyl-CoA thioesterase FadM